MDGFWVVTADTLDPSNLIVNFIHPLAIVGPFLVAA